MNTAQIHNMFRANRPSSGVHVVVMKESAAHYNAVLLFLRPVHITRARATAYTHYE
jgi:hypothetical protein